MRTSSKCPAHPEKARFCYSGGPVGARRDYGGTTVGRRNPRNATLVSYFRTVRSSSAVMSICNRCHNNPLRVQFPSKTAYGGQGRSADLRKLQLCQQEQAHFPCVTQLRSRVLPHYDKRLPSIAGPQKQAPKAALASVLPCALKSPRWTDHEASIERKGTGTAAC
jgi:hypothetical protein